MEIVVKKDTVHDFVRIMTLLLRKTVIEVLGSRGTGDARIYIIQKTVWMIKSDNIYKTFGIQQHPAQKVILSCYFI